MLKKMLAVCMAFVTVFTVFSFRVCALANEPDDAWDAYWDEVKDNHSQISLNPGADISQLNFNWHSALTLAVPRVRISKNADMHPFTEFKGYATPAEKGEQTNRVTVTGLEASTVYYYTYALGKEPFSAPCACRTPASDHWKALYIGDAQCDLAEDGYASKDAKNWNTLLNQAIACNDDLSLILHLGDQTQHGDNALEWAGTLAPQALRSIPIATTVGNHDKKGYNYQFYVNNPNSYYGYTPSLVGRGYYFMYGDVLLISVNSTQYNLFDQYDLVEKAVAAHPEAKWRVLMMHHDVYGTGHHARDEESRVMQACYSAICDKFEIDVCLAGHEHFYGRSYFMYNNQPVDAGGSGNTATNPKGTLYLTAASGSGKNRYYDEYQRNDPWICFDYMTRDMVYSTVEFTPTTFCVKTFDMQQNLIDSYTIVKTEQNYAPVDTRENLLLNTNAVDRILQYLTGDYYVIFQVIYKVADLLKTLLPVSAFSIFAG